MNKDEFRKTDEYAKAVAKIKGYPKGFGFTIPYYKMTDGQYRAMMVITRDMMDEKVIDSEWIGESFESILGSRMHEEHFKRI